jgi:hypothetical protein
LPPAESAKSSASQDAPGIPSSARDHSLSPGSRHAATGTVPRITEISSYKFRRFGTVPRASWPIHSGAGAPGSSYFGFWIEEKEMQQEIKASVAILDPRPGPVLNWIGDRGQILDWKKKTGNHR